MVLAHLFVRVLRLGDSKVTLSGSSEAATCYYLSNHSKVKGDTVKVSFPRTQQANLLTCSPC